MVLCSQTGLCWVNVFYLKYCHSTQSNFLYRHPVNATDTMLRMCSHVGIRYLGSSQRQILRLWAWKMYCHIFQYLDTCLKIHVTWDKLLCLEQTHLRHQELLTQWHTITSQKTWIFSNTTMRISYPHVSCCFADGPEDHSVNVSAL